MVTTVFDFETAARLGVAGLAGLAVGVEREWSGHAAGPHARFAGVRTFFLMGLLAGIAGWLADGGMGAVAAALMVGGAALTVSAYLVAAWGAGERIDGTTEAAALLVLALGAAAGLGHLRIVSAATAVTVFALGEKSRIEGLVRRIDEAELRGALEFAVLALVILPLLPEGPFGPLGGVRPRTLWTVVLFFSALNYAGYIARRAIGESRGAEIAGLLGGAMSSTAVTFQFSRRSRAEPSLSTALGAGVIGACTVLLPRVGVVTLVLNPAMAITLVPYLLPPFLIGVFLTVRPLLQARAEEPVDRVPDPKSPLGLWSSIRMALAFQLVLMAIFVVRQRFGTPGVLTSAGLLGLTDMDALTLAMSRLGTDSAMLTLGAKAIAIGVLSNTVLKFALGVTLGSHRFRRTAGWGLVALGAGSLLGLWLGP